MKGLALIEFDLHKSFQKDFVVEPTNLNKDVQKTYIAWILLTDAMQEKPRIP